MVQKMNFHEKNNAEELKSLRRQAVFCCLHRGKVKGHRC